VFSGVVPESGEIVLSGITDAKLPELPLAPYQVSIDGKRLGSFGFSEQTTTERFEFVPQHASAEQREGLREIGARMREAVAGGDLNTYSNLNRELHALIATDGAVRSLQVLEGDPMFYQSALDAVRQWRYKPTFLNGRPVEVDTHITVIYKLNR